MKPRKVLVSLELETDIPMKFLKDKRRWQSLLDYCYNLTMKPTAIFYDVKKVEARKLFVDRFGTII